MDAQKDVAAGFSLVRNDALFRLQRSVGLIPKDGSGIGRRAVLYALIAWLPLMIWAWANSRLVSGEVAEPLLAHYGIHVRCLVAIPLLIIAEAAAHSIMPACLRQFVQTGLVDAETLPRFRAIIADGIRLRDQTLPWIVIAGLVCFWTGGVVMQPNVDEIGWASAGEFNFGVWWFLLVVRPLFSILLLGWLWRSLLLGIMLFRIARLPLALVPPHPDKVGGLGFLERMPFILSPVVFSVSAVVAASWAHRVNYHEVAVPSLYPEMGMLVAVLMMIVLAPMVFFTPLLSKVRKKAKADYGALLTEHGRLVHRRWIQKEEVGTPAILDAPELGPVADIQALYEATRTMRSMVVGKGAVMAVVIPAVLPILCVVAMQWPLKTTLKRLLMALV